MALWIIECGLLVGMIGLIWVMLDIFAGDHHTNDKQQDCALQDHSYSMRLPVRPAPVSQTS
jgi:hypothetical protein